MKPQPDIQDARFSELSRDPRFKKMAKKQSKTPVDERFSKALKDTHSTNSNIVDKYGRAPHNKSALSTSKKDSLPPPKKDFSRKAVESPVQYDQVSDDEDISESVSDSSTDISDIELEDDEVCVDLEEILDLSNVPVGDETNRLACVNVDWDRVKAVDLLALFSSFVGNGGKIHSVRIYPSQFGKIRLEEEERFGPSKDIFAPKKRGNGVAGTNTDENDGVAYDENSEGDEVEVYKDFLHKDQTDDSDDSDDSDNESITDEQLKAELFADHDKHGSKESAGFDNERLRRYQLERLRYFYAIVECDSASTASRIYHACDGTELQVSSNCVDLRFVPNDVSFKDEDPSDEANTIPVEYRAPRFVTRALQHSKVELTWDMDDTDRMRVMKRRFTKDNLKDMDFSAFLASSSSEDEEEKKNTRDKYRQLLVGENNENVFDKPENSEGDMTITFKSGLSDIASQLVTEKKEKDALEGATVWEKYISDKKKKKKLRAKEKSIGKQSDNDVVMDDEYDGRDEDDPFFKDAMKDYEHEFNPSTKKEKKSSKTKKLIPGDDIDGENKKKERAELELLMMDEKEFQLEQNEKNEKKSKKEKRKKEKKSKEGYSVDTSDPRFASLFNSHEYAIDPNHPQFKETTAIKEIMSERRARGAHSRNETVPSKQLHQDTELTSLVNKLKTPSVSKIQKRKR